MLGILVFVTALTWFNISRSHPQVEGQIRMPGIEGRIEIIRDVDGVPHIYADTAHDVMFAQGFAEAQDRYWQMDFFRHVGNGELSEMFGASQIETDRFLRSMGWGDIAQRELLSLDLIVVEYLEAYAAGVNAFSDGRSGGELSFEHYVLRAIARSYTPDRWTAADSLVFSKVLAWDLSGNLDEEIERSLLAGLMPIAQVEELYPDYPPDHPVIAPSDLLVSAGSAPDAPLSLAGPHFEELSETFSSLDQLLGARGPMIGSNNWAVSGDLTSTGEPLLANDPHLGIVMPSLWYEVGLHCYTVTASCPFDVVGFSLPGSPAVLIGHNADIAWGVTNLNPDEMDLYIEKLNPDNPLQYEYMGQWVDVETRTETIVVAGAETEQLVVHSTIHGPIISDTYDRLDTFDDAGIDLPESYAIAMSWTALEESTIAEAVFEMNTASNWSEFRAAVSKWDIAGQNFVYADTAGNIGYQSSGDYPIRAQDGRWPVPGWTGEYEWTGTVPFSEMPSIFNPDRGYVASANQPLVDDAYPFHIHDDVSYGYRAQRIEDLLLAADGSLDAAYMRAMQSDARSEGGAIVVPYVVALDDDSPDADLVKRVLSEWSSGNSHPHSNAYQMTGDQPGAALFASLWRHLLIHTFHDELPEDYHPFGTGRWWTIMEGLLADPTSHWWDDQRTEQVEERDDILRRAIVDAIEELGTDIDIWDWTEMHTATFENASLGQSGIAPLEWILNSDSYGVSGGASILNATWWDARDNTYDVIAVPSMRMIVDLSNFSASTSLLTTGQSGRPGHDHYDDMIERWVANDPHPMRWTRDDVDDAEANSLLLIPAG